MPGFLSSLTNETLLVLAAYGASLAPTWWQCPWPNGLTTKRWTVMGKIERTAVYGWSSSSSLG